ncbi:MULTISPECIES: hypothetical protein [unclassified Streptomyces]|uniref:hypothetical protein n=1 Tax=unclassified Streptomyces TaxID=2593676 RepID=UPI0022704430|nr:MULTISPECIES: hypothetical protein [unclassified Streptomyces]MCY0917017.1 hypothetical protein [Streptomyces sp. H27-G5]MCY0959957.1 hypothetical protein [Streptomyces sp. H27-H5]
MPESTWPEGTLARYLAVGGASVGVLEASEWMPEYALCYGCGRSSSDGGPDSSQPDRWAQSHAETCRAMPRPTA